MNLRSSSKSLLAGLLCSLSAPALLSQVIQIRSAESDPGEQKFQINDTLPVPALSAPKVGEVGLLPGLFRERRELTKAYILRLKTENLLQNHLLEAGVRIDTPLEQMHQGWESPHCQLRGHFAGHWLSAAAHYTATDHDPVMATRTREVVQGLLRCQELNGGQWVGSIPTKFFDVLRDQKRWIWSPQYTLHKTLLGLLDAYRLTQDKEALQVLEHAADWFDQWTAQLIKDGRGEVVYGGECAGMLELWSDLYAITKNPRHLSLASRYAMPDLFRGLQAKTDTLSNDHANASIPWIEGAARLYEVTGDARYRTIVEAFWKQAVENRGMFATTGNNAGEFWIPAGQFGRFLGNRTQEHCTVYNMIRVADTLLRWTGEARYADYIERALYNGILAQQNPNTGIVSYFLPLQPGAKKQWGTETHDFWCCHGTLVQAQSQFEDLIYYKNGHDVTVSQFISSQASFGEKGTQVRLTQKTDPSSKRRNFSSPGEITHFDTELTVDCDSAAPWTLRIRLPQWAIGSASITIDGSPIEARTTNEGFIELRREWKSSLVHVSFAKKITREPLPGDATRFALLDGPLVLAALTDREPEVQGTGEYTPLYEHQYVEAREWQGSHYLVRTTQGSVEVKPIFEIADERYTVYFNSKP